MFGKQRRPMKDAAISITSMMDMLTIIILFLLVNIGRPDHLKINKDVSLPLSTANYQLQADITEAVPVIVTKDAILVDDTAILTIKDGKIQGKVEGDRIVELANALSVARSKIVSQKGYAEDKPQKILLHADKSLEYDLINKVIKTAAEAGFPQFRFAVLRQKS